jgi:hypothetical protein
MWPHQSNSSVSYCRTQCNRHVPMKGCESTHLVARLLGRLRNDALDCAFGCRPLYAFVELIDGLLGSSPVRREANELVRPTPATWVLDGRARLVHTDRERGISGGENIPARGFFWECKTETINAVRGEFIEMSACRRFAPTGITRKTIFFPRQARRHRLGVIDPILL